MAKIVSPPRATLDVEISYADFLAWVKEEVKKETDGDKGEISSITIVSGPSDNFRASVAIVTRGA